MFWIREIVGWLFIALGLVAFGNCYMLVRDGKVFSPGPMVLIGIFLFRGGIHFLKVAVAARICQRPEPKKPRPALAPRGR